MLLGPILHYLLEYSLLLILSFDTLGFIINHNKTKDESENSVKDYSRIVFSWIFVLSLKSLNCSIIPLIDEIVLAGIIFFSLPILHGSEKASNFLFREDGFKKFSQRLIDLIINRLVGEKKN